MFGFQVNKTVYDLFALDYLLISHLLLHQKGWERVNILRNRETNITTIHQHCKIQAFIVVSVKNATPEL
jgi:hypothetical protein